MNLETISASVRSDDWPGLSSYSLLGAVIFLGYAWSAHLSPEQLVEFIRAFIWPITALIIANLFRSETSGIISRVARRSLGRMELQTSQTIPTAGVAAPLIDSPEERALFERYNVELVPNTKAALSWFSSQRFPVTLSAFIQIFALPNPVPPETDLLVQKFAIFNALQLRGLIENHRINQFRVSRKGDRYLRFNGIETARSKKILVTMPAKATDTALQAATSSSSAR